MKTALFKPLWKPFVLVPVTESSGVSVQTALAIRAVIMLDPGETQISLRVTDIPYITDVRVDNVSVIGYSISGTTLTFNSQNLQGGVPQTAVVEIDRDADINYTIFIGQCVPGIQIDTEGRLRGVVGNIASLTEKDYTFGIRAEWEGLTADVIKMWTAIPVNNQLSWNFTTLPDAKQDTSLVLNGRVYYTLGEIKRGQYIEAGIDVINPDGTSLNFQTREAIDMAVSATSFSALPVDIQMSNNPILFKGLVTADATPGDYLTELYVDHPLAPPPIIIHFRVLATTYSQQIPISRLHWLSDSYLGIIKESSPSSLSVSAVADGPLTYSIAPGSRSLPTGLTLTSSGEIRGIGPNIDVDQTINFTVKAVSESLFSEKEFTIDLVNVLAPRRSFMTAKLPLSGPIRSAWQSYSGQIPTELRYRPGDSLFPVANPNATLVRGLTSRSIPDLEYDEPFWTVLGAFKIAQVMDLSGQPLYDVVYRELIDPLARAGGFAQGSTVIERPEFYPQDRFIKLADASIHNLRYDLVRKIGLNSEVDKANTLGLDGGEILDPWMTATQKNGTVLGYVAAGVIAYVLPNTGKELIENLLYGDLPEGKVVRFDRLLIEDGNTRYFYHLGMENNAAAIVPGDTLPPINLRINGIAVESLRGSQYNPTITWESQQDDVLYTLRIYNSYRTLLRETSSIEANMFYYNNTLWATDGLPSSVIVEVEAIFEGRSSSVLTGAFSLRAGWSFSWGFVYGGESTGTGLRDASIAAAIQVASSIMTIHLQPPVGDIISPIVVQPLVTGVLTPIGTIDSLVNVIGYAANRYFGTISSAIDVVPSLSEKRFGPIATPITVVPTLVGNYVRPQRFGTIGSAIQVGANASGTVVFPDGAAVLYGVIEVLSAMVGTRGFGLDTLSAAVIVTPALVGIQKLTGTVMSTIDVSAAMIGNSNVPAVTGVSNNVIQVVPNIRGSRIYIGSASAPIIVQPAIAGTFFSLTTGALSNDIVVTPTAIGTHTNAFTATINLTSGSTTNLRTLANAAGYMGNQAANITFYVPNAVTVRGVGGANGIETGTWPAYTHTLSVIVQSGGIVDGAGGAGGEGNSNAGFGGAHAINCSTPISVTINSGGVVRGGGGGGTGGPSDRDYQTTEEVGDPSLGGGGGGGGAPNGAAGLGGSGDISGSDGSVGTTSGGGLGGNGAVGTWRNGGTGGVGGGFGAAGSPGGAAGYAVRKNGNTVPVTNNGTMTGSAA